MKEKERLFMCEHARIMSHQQQIDLGMLSACATSYYPAIENKAANIEVTEKKSNVMKREKETR